MRINGVNLHVAEPVGDGELLVLVHGGWTDHTTWNAIVEPLAQTFRVVRYDRRGHSRSEYAGPSPRRQDEDDLAMLIEALGAPAHLVGTSYGASISLSLAGRRPELVRSVFAHEPPLLGVAPDAEAEAFMDGVIDQLESGEVESATKRFFESVLGDGAWERIPEPLRRAAMGNRQTFVDLRADPQWASLDVAAVRRFAGPVTITVGSATPGWLPAVAWKLAEVLGRDMRVIDGATHAPHLTHPDALVALVEERVGSLDRSREAA